MSRPTLLLRQVYSLNERDSVVDERFDRLRAAIYNRTVPVEIEVRRHQKKRTPEAQGYLWGVCYPLMSDASGYEKEEIHYAMCCKYFGVKVVEVMGQRFERPVRTTSTNEEGEAEWLGSHGFAEFTDFVIREAANWYDVSIPPPTPKVNLDGH